MCDDFMCPYRSNSGYCELSACVKPQTYTTNRTVPKEPLRVCPHCGKPLNYWYEEAEEWNI